MKKGYWVSAYREIKDHKKFASYAKIAGPAIIEAGGNFLIRGLPTKTFEYGLTERTVVVEFDSIEAALDAHESPEYIRALRALGDGAIRDFRIIEGT